MNGQESHGFPVHLLLAADPRVISIVFRSSPREDLSIFPDIADERGGSQKVGHPQARRLKRVSQNSA